jgi:dTMP kinase
MAKTEHGIFISFEGIDFSGKSEQCRRLLERLHAAGYANAELLREPGGVEIAEAIRKIVLDAKHAGLNERTEILLYSAARAQIVGERILPALAAGKIIIADRFVDSTTAFQGHGRQINLEFVRAVNRFATRDILPQLTLLLDISLEEAEARQRRAGIAKDRLENEGREFHERVRTAYLELARAEPQRFVVLDGAQSIDALAEQINATVHQRFGLKV